MYESAPYTRSDVSVYPECQYEGLEVSLVSFSHIRRFEKIHND